MKEAFEVKELSADTWPDFETLFGKHKGVRGGCWCTFNRCTSLELSSSETPDWRISCLFADKHRRREGLAKFALHSAMASIRRRGGGIVEAFPLVVPGTCHPQYTGSTKMYKREGFREVTRLGKNTVLMRLAVPTDEHRKAE